MADLSSCTDSDQTHQLFVGRLFDNFKDFEVAVEFYGRRNNTLFVKDNCKKSKHVEGLYDYAVLVCKQGGRMKKSTSRGIRHNITTYKCGCPVMVRVTSLKCPTSGKFIYRVTRVILEHNHPVSEAIYRSYPESRRAAVTDYVESLLSYKPPITSLDVRLHVEQDQERTLPVSQDKTEALIQRLDLMEERMDELEEENKGLKKEIASLKKQNIDYQEELSALKSNMTSLDRKYRVKVHQEASSPTIEIPDCKERLTKMIRDQMESRKRKFDD